MRRAGQFEISMQRNTIWSWQRRTGLLRKLRSRPMAGQGMVALSLSSLEKMMRSLTCLLPRLEMRLWLSTETGMAIRFRESDARPMGRNTSGVKGISLTPGDKVVGMVVADPESNGTDCLRKGVWQTNHVWGELKDRRRIRRSRRAIPSMVARDTALKSVVEKGFAI